MKFNWGTGILIFLILFLMAAGVFIGFAMRQDVNLVHEDYYEKGVDYAKQMNAEARSVAFRDSIASHFEDQFLVVTFQGSQEMRIDSGAVLLYRPSSSSLDLNMPFDFSIGYLNIPGSELYSGRYILKLYWYSEGLKYEVDKAIHVP
ncbi:MAG: FixH family protein [Bacteroidota bacterium]